MTGQLKLWPGWAPEPCDTGVDVDLAEWLHTSRPSAAITPDHGRPAGRSTWRGFKPIHSIRPTGDLL